MMSLLHVLSEPVHVFCKVYLLLPAQWNKSSFLLHSFHVGSGCYDASAFGTAVLAARSVFDLGVSEVTLHFFGTSILCPLLWSVLGKTINFLLENYVMKKTTTCLL